MGWQRHPVTACIGLRQDQSIYAVTKWRQIAQDSLFILWTGHNFLPSPPHPDSRPYFPLKQRNSNRSVYNAALITSAGFPLIWLNKTWDKTNLLFNYCATVFVLFFFSYDYLLSEFFFFDQHLWLIFISFDLTVRNYIILHFFITFCGDCGDIVLVCHRGVYFGYRYNCKFFSAAKEWTVEAEIKVWRAITV